MGIDDNIDTQTDDIKTDIKQEATEVKHSGLRKLFNSWSPRSIIGIGIVMLLSAKFIFDFPGFGSLVSEIGNFFMSLLSYLLGGFVLAYVLNAYITWMERRPFRRMKSGNKKRYLCIIIAYLTLLAMVVFLIFAIVPKLVESVTNLARMVPDLAETVTEFYNDVMEGGRFNLPNIVKENIENGLTGVKDYLISILNVDFITSIGTRILTATGTGIFNIIMSLLVSVYMLLEKKSAAVAAKRIVSGVFKPSRSLWIQEAGRKIDMIFKRYFTGKLTQALIILLLSYVVLLIGGVNYAILFATIMGLTNMIPYIGPWIGAVPPVLISLVQDPWMGLRALICVLVVQLIDNWFITPRVVGGKMGISPLLVLIGLCVGSTLFGFIGMIIGDVLAAIVKVFFYDSFIEHRLQKRVAAGELPPDCLEREEETPDKTPLTTRLWIKMRDAVRRKK